MSGFPSSPVTETVNIADRLRRLAGGKRPVAEGSLDHTMLAAADEIERLRADYRFLTESWHTAKRNQFAAEAAASAGHAQTPAETDEDHPDCVTARERELYFALMGLAGAVMTRRREWDNWMQGGIKIAPVVRKALRLDVSDTSTDRPADCPLCPGFSTPCGNTNCPQLVSSPNREAGK